MSQIPQRTIANSADDHIADHNELARLHDLYDPDAVLGLISVTGIGGPPVPCTATQFPIRMGGLNGTSLFIATFGVAASGSPGTFGLRLTANKIASYTLDFLTVKVMSMSGNVVASITGSDALLSFVSGSALQNSTLVSGDNKLSFSTSGNNSYVAIDSGTHYTFTFQPGTHVVSLSAAVTAI